MPLPPYYDMNSYEMKDANDVVRSDLDALCARLEPELRTMEGGHVLIVGGAGFLGYYLVQALLRWNDVQNGTIRVTVLDSYARGVPAWLDELRARPELHTLRHDITQPLPRVDACDYIVHAATIASPTFYRKHPIATMDANVTGLRRLLDHAVEQASRGQAVKGFLFFSSSEIYGDPTPGNVPTPESYLGNVSCVGPRACYDESKRYGETLSVNFARVHDLPVRIVRPFNNYGPGLKITDKRVVPDFARDILEGRDVVLLSDGKPMRTFCYVADAVSGYIKALVRGRDGEPYNIGVEAPEISIADLAERMVASARDLFGYSGRVILGKSDDPHYLVDNPNRRCPVIDKARSELGYDPIVSLDEGLRRTLLWYRDHRAVDEVEA